MKNTSLAAAVQAAVGAVAPVEQAAAANPDTTAAANATALENARAEGAREGAAAERARVAGILNANEAQGREQLARHLAFSTDMTPEAAAAVLAASPRQAEAAPAQPARMIPDPQVDAGAPAAAAQTPDDALVASAKEFAAKLGR